MSSEQNILNNASGSTITGNTINNYLKEDNKLLLEALHKRVATNAILNAGGRADELRCYPGTRVEVISDINEWRDGQDGSTAPVFWLNGPAGAGKSAIVQTIADDWMVQEVPQANFFFFGTDATRNSPDPLVATLLYQLIPLYPPLAKDVAAVLSTRPLIFDSVLTDQLARLIVAPLRKIQKSSPPYLLPTFLIDGLDECNAESKQGQRQIIAAFDKVMAQQPCPFRLLMASRDEPHIRAAFEEMTSVQATSGRVQLYTIARNPFDSYLAAEPSLEALYERVTSNAILNAGGRDDDVLCHPGTRVDVFGDIEKWRNKQGTSLAPIFWLNGPAGGGKSAIVQTIAECWMEQDIPQANFFFFRMDRTRNGIFSLVGTLLYQLIPLYPPLAKAVASVLSVDPLIFDSTFDEQLTRLIVAPLRKIQDSSTCYRLPALLIDGLDECNSNSKEDQSQILGAFRKALSKHPCPFKLLVASRDEAHIRAALEEMDSPQTAPDCVQYYTISRDTFDVYLKAEPTLEILHKYVALNAMLNARGRTDKKKYHPGTRTDVISDIERWRDGHGSSIFWLTGPAGAGKSAIAQMLVAQWTEENVIQAHFFFLRMDNTRNTIAPLLGTLLYQLIPLYPPLAKSVTALLSIDSSIFDSTFEDQLTRLIVAPLSKIQQSSTYYCPPTLLIDGLNECNAESKHDQRQILAAFNKVMAQHSCLFRLLVTSCDEPQINAAFEGTFELVQRYAIKRNSFETYLKAEPSLRVLHKCAALNAVFDIEGCSNHVKCHPGTRIEVISDVERWKDEQGSSTAPIFWLSGPVNGGKSTIVRTIAYRWKEQDIPQANFFFLHTDGTRNTASPLIATLLYQLIPLYPPLAKAVAAVISASPLIFNSTLDDQLSQLVVAPLHGIKESSMSYHPPIFLIDGIDECNPKNKDSAQFEVPAAFVKVLSLRPCLFRLLLASRDHLKLHPAFDGLISPQTALSNYVHNHTISRNPFNTYLKAEPLLEVLRRRVAPNAVLDGGGRADHDRCHLGTRVEVIADIEKWRDGQGNSMAPIFWLSGPAGGGKSAIMRTIAERWKKQDVPQANFFFLKTDNTRNSASPLIATLLYQLIPFYPPLAKAVAAVISAFPSIFDSILEYQVARLIVTPLRKIQAVSPSYRPPTLVIDGLDECNAESKHVQRQILTAFYKVMAQHPCPLCLLVASRDGSQINAAFEDMSSPPDSLYLDNKSRAERDIQIFVNSQFKQIKETHPFANTLPVAWPSAKDVNNIVQKSSGQFAYAAAVMHFLMHHAASPMLSLEELHKCGHIYARSPFVHMDSSFTYVLSQVTNQRALKDILEAHFYLRNQRLYFFCNCDANSVTHIDSSSCKANSLKLREDITDILPVMSSKYKDTMYIRSCLADLTPVAHFDGNHLVFHHVSFSDYILDPSRSGSYSVNITLMHRFNAKAFTIYTLKTLRDDI